MTNFKIEGGRGGKITFDYDGRSGYLSWEMLVGEVDLAIYLIDSRWTSPQIGQFEPEEISFILDEFAIWAKAKKLTFEIIA